MRFALSFVLSVSALAAHAEVPQVVADLPPVASLVAQVMGGLGSPEVLVDQGANAHSFQLRPSQAAGLQGADLVVWLGPEMTPWLERVLADTGNATQLGLLATEGTHRQEFGAGTHDEDHAEEEHDDDGHDHTGLDPHAWLDPGNAALWLGLIAAELSRLDPENAATYAANATTAKAELAALDGEIATLLAPVKDRPFVVFHDAYGYFTGHYGLTTAAAIAMGDAASPGAAHLAEVQATMASAPLCIFPEVNHDPKLVAQLAEATGAKPGGALDPEGSGLPPGPALYTDLMRGMAHTLADCLAD